MQHHWAVGICGPPHSSDHKAFHFLFRDRSLQHTCSSYSLVLSSPDLPYISGLLGPSLSPSSARLLTTASVSREGGGGLGKRWGFAHTLGCAAVLVKEFSFPLNFRLTLCGTVTVTTAALPGRGSGRGWEKKKEETGELPTASDPEGPFPTPQTRKHSCS
jgi:hypothetical protein